MSEVVSCDVGTGRLNWLEVERRCERGVGEAVLNQNSRGAINSRNEVSVYCHEDGSGASILDLLRFHLMDTTYPLARRRG